MASASKKRQQNRKSGPDRKTKKNRKGTDLHPITSVGNNYSSRPQVMAHPVGRTRH